MTCVEQKQPGIRWADEIKVKVRNGVVSFQGSKFFVPGSAGIERDMLAEYWRTITSAVGEAAEAPHYAFASGTSRQEILAFCERFGPISVKAESFVSSLNGTLGISLKASQDWESLRREHLTYVSLLNLYREARSEAPEPVEIFNAASNIQVGASIWVEQYREEVEIGQRDPMLAGGPRWIWDAARQGDLQGHVAELKTLVHETQAGRGDTSRRVERLREQSHRLLCLVVSAFPPIITRFNDVTVEMPSENVALGTRHVLYFFLRNDYLRGTGISKCAWHDCAKWFPISGRESSCCSPEHGLKYRQKKYYHESRGKELRAERYKKAHKVATQKGK